MKTIKTQTIVEKVNFRFLFIVFKAWLNGQRLIINSENTIINYLKEEEFTN